MLRYKKFKDPSAPGAETSLYLIVTWPAVPPEMTPVRSSPWLLETSKFVMSSSLLSTMLEEMVSLPPPSVLVMVEMPPEESNVSVPP